MFIELDILCDVMVRLSDHGWSQVQALGQVKPNTDKPVLRGHHWDQEKVAL